MRTDCSALNAELPSQAWIDRADQHSDDSLFQPLAQARPSPNCEVCVIVPVRNEAEILEKTLTALEHQVDLEGNRLDPTRYEVILLLNNCTDRSATIAHRFKHRHPAMMLHIAERTLPTNQAYIGRVRQMLMDEAYQRLISQDRNQGIIASTDGDTRVAPNWIAATLHEISLGADAVGGRIVTDRQERAALDPYAKACYLREVGYRYLVAELETYLDADPSDRTPRHYQHYGASLAVTAEMYIKAGGMPPVRTPEDVAFYRALLRAGARFRHSPLVRVTTSARSTGRASFGLANQLQEWALMGQRHQPFLVESAAAIETLFCARRDLRQLWWHRSDRSSAIWEVSDLVTASNKLGVSAQWLMCELARSQSFDALFEQVEQQQQQEGKWRQRWMLVPIEQAIADLRLRLNTWRQMASSQISAPQIPSSQISA